jgi:hypothetical protein
MISVSYLIGFIILFELSIEIYGNSAKSLKACLFLNFVSVRLFLLFPLDLRELVIRVFWDLVFKEKV